MFTTHQFTQLAAAAWPLVTFTISVAEYCHAGQPGSPLYTVCYRQVGIYAADSHDYTGVGSTPFEAVADAIEEAWCGSAFSSSFYHSATATIEQAAAEFAGAPADV